MWEALFSDRLKHARAGVAEAQYEVGIMYLKGQGVAQDRHQALEWLQAASDAGYQLAGGKLDRIREQEEKFEQLLGSAQAGDPDARYEVAMMYLKGRGVEASGREARAWLQRAVDDGDTRATARLGILNYKGEGGDVDYPKALSLLTRVSDHSVLAQYYLGEMYATGSGVAPDHRAAIDWYTRAADGGFNRARGKIINLQEQIKIAARRRLKVAPVEAPQAAVRADAMRAKETRRPAAQLPSSPAAEPVAPPPVSSFDSLTGRQWRRGDRPVDYLPSRVAQCDTDDDSLVCFSEVLERVTGAKTVEYRVKSIIRHDRDTFTIVYRNLVLDVTDTEEPEDEPSGYSDQVDQGFHVRTGWTPEHSVICGEVSDDGLLDCVKDNTHRFELEADS
jgi:TPR repeat protein